MEFNHVTVVLMGFFLVLCSQAIMGFRIEISPSRYTEDSAGPVNIACIVESVDECVNKGVLKLELRKDEQELVASVNQRDGFRYGSNSPKKYQGQGSVENHHNNRSFLNVSIMTPDNEDAGLYTCSMLYFNEAGDDKKDHVSKNLTVEIFNAHTMLKTMMKTVRRLEDEVKEKDNALQMAVMDLTEMHHNHSQYMMSELAQKENALQTAVRDLAQMHHNHSQQLAQKDNELQELRALYHNHSLHLARRDSLDAVVAMVTSLEDKARNQSHDFKDLAEKVTYSVTFSAALKTDKSFASGSVVVFDDIILNEGNHYDQTTGIFTAPRAGLYAFDVAARLSTSNSNAILHIKANDVITASLYAYDKGSGPHSSATCVRELVKGDQVKAVSGDYTAKLSNWHRMTLFTGYLVRAY